MVVVHPLQEGDRLRHLGVRQARRAILQLGDELTADRAHRAPVLDRGRDLAENVFEMSRDLRAVLVGLLVDLDVHDRFVQRPGGVGLVDDGLQPAARGALDQHHRMDHEMHLGAHVVDAQSHGVDEEGLIVVDHLDHGVADRPAVGVLPRIENPHLRRARRPLGHRFPKRVRGPGQVLGRHAAQIVGRNVLVKSPGEVDQRICGLSAACLLADMSGYLIDDLGKLGLRLSGHYFPPRRALPAGPHNRAIPEKATAISEAKKSPFVTRPLLFTRPRATWRSVVRLSF